MPINTKNHLYDILVKIATTTHFSLLHSKANKVILTIDHIRETQEPSDSIKGKINCILMAVIILYQPSKHAIHSKKEAMRQQFPTQ